MKYWKFEYVDSEDVSRCINEQSLPKDINVAGLENTYNYPLSQFRAGDGLIIAKLDGEKAIIHAVGKIIEIHDNKHDSLVQWGEITKTVYPNPQGGLPNWKKKTAFEIKPEPAKRYQLQKLIDKYVTQETELISDNEASYFNEEAEEGYLIDRKILSSQRNKALSSKRRKIDNNTCQACGFHLQVENKFVIDVHHQKPFQGNGVRVTKINDLISLCPTCHSIAHLRKPPYSLKEIIELLSESINA